MRITPFPARAAVAAALVFAMTSCGWESDGGARLDQLYHGDAGSRDTPSDPGTRDAPADTATDEATTPSDEGNFDLSPGDVPAGLAGTWAVRIVQKGEISPISDPYPIVTPDYFVGVVEPDGTVMSLTFCDEQPVVDSGDSGLEFKTSTTAALRAALAEVPVAIALAGDGASMPAQTVVWTWGLQDLGPTDPMPTTAGDPKVLDQDGDGKPGVTVDVAGLVSGKRYMVKRATWELSAGELSGDRTRLDGTLTYTLEEEPLGADPAMLNQKTPITPKDGSTFRFRRVGAVTCATLLPRVDEVFGSVP